MTARGGRTGRLARFARRAVVVAAIATVLALVLLRWGLARPEAAAWLRTNIERVAGERLGGTVRIGALGVSLTEGLELSGLVLRLPESLQATVTSVRITPAVLGWWPPAVGLRVRLQGPRIEADLTPLLAASSDEVALGVLMPAWLGAAEVDLSGGELALRGLGTPEVLRLDEVDLRVRFKDGILRTPRLEVSVLKARLAHGSRLRIAGDVGLDAGLGLALEVHLDKLDLRDLEPWMGPQPRGGELAGELRLAGSLDAPVLTGVVQPAPSGGAMRFAIRAPGSGAAALPTFRQSVPEFEPTPQDWDVILETDGLSPVALRTDLPAGRIDAVAHLTVAPTGAIRGRLDLDRSTLAGWALDPGHADFARDLAGVLSSTFAGGVFDGAVQVSGRTTLSSAHKLAGVLELTLNDPAPLPPPAAALFAESRFGARVEIDARLVAGGLPHGTLGLVAGPGIAAGVAFDALAAKLGLAEGQAVLESLHLRSGASEIEGKASLAMDTGGGLSAEFTGVLDPALVGVAAPLTELRLTATGMLAAVDVDLALTTRAAPSSALPTTAARFGLEARALGSPRGQFVITGEGRSWPVGFLEKLLGDNAQDWRLRAEGALAGRDLRTGRFDLAAVSDDGRRHELILDARVSESGPSGPGIGLRVSQATLVLPGDHRIALGRSAEILFDHEAITVRDLELQADGGRFALAGVLARRGGRSSDLMATLDGLPLKVLCLAAGAEDDCDGRLSGGLVVRGDPDRPEIRLDLAARALAVAEESYGGLTVSARVAPGGPLVANVDLGVRRLGQARADLRLPLVFIEGLPALAAEAPLVGHLTAESLAVAGLRPLIAGDLLELDGTVDAKLSLSGTVTKPVVEGFVRARGLDIGLDSPEVRLSDGRFDFRFGRDAWVLSDLAFDQGRVAGAGVARLVAGASPALDFDFRLDRALLMQTVEIEAAVSGDTALGGTLAAPVLKGTLVVSPATLRPAVGSGGPGAADPTVEVSYEFDPAAAWPAGVPPEETADEAEMRRRGAAAGWPVAAATVELDVTVGPRVAVRRFDAFADLAGSVAIRKAPGGSLAVKGEIASSRGWVVFQGRRLRIERARLLFAGDDPPDPLLDIRAVYDAPHYRVTVAVEGTAGAPRVRLSSMPPLEERDVLSVLLFGEPAARLTTDQSNVLQQQALAMLASWVAPELEGSILDQLGLTSLTFRMPSGDTAGTVGLGRYLTEEIFVSVGQDFGGPVGGTGRQLDGLVGTSVQIQYRFSPTIGIEAGSSTQGESTIDLFWRRRY